jgi:integrase
MARVNLTERRIAALTDPSGKRAELRDALVPSLIVRCAARRKVFALHTRFPGARHPTRRVIGEVGALTIDAAREVARSWLALIRQGRDPSEELRRQREAERAAHAVLFRAVADDYIARRLAGQRRGRAVERIVRRELVAAWGDKPVTAITRRDVLDLVEGIDARGAPVMAAAVFGAARTLFGWARNRALLEHSPCDGVRVSGLVSRTKQPRQRTLSDDEVRAFWRATGELSQPWQQAFRLLLLTGVRRTEALGATWSEFSDLDDPANAVWRIPPARFKSQVEHIVPLSPAALAVVATVPRHQHGPFVFSCTHGRTPALVLHQAKGRLDDLMRRELPALEPWQAHDLRRVLRTALARLGVQDHIAEACLGHARRGLQGVYDKHSYLPETRRALALWAAELNRIVSPQPGATVLPLRGKRGER